MPVTTIRGGRQITDGTIPYADIQTVTANAILGNNTASATSIQEIALATNTVLGRGAGNISALTLGTGLSIAGTVLQPTANLQSLAGLNYASTSFVKMTAAGTFALDTATYEPTIAAGTTAQYWRGDKSWQTLNTAAVAESGNLYYTDARARAALSFTAGSGAYNSTTGVITIPTNTNQLTNGAGFITGESDTLTSVTGRGASTPSNMTIANTNPIFILKDTDNSGTGVGQVGYISFQDSGNTERAWIGYGSAGSNNFTITNNKGDVVLSASTGVAYVGSNIILHAGNYNSYAPTLTGGNASGTWGINITGNAATVSGFKNIGNIGVQAVAGTNQTCTTAQFLTWYQANYAFKSYYYTVAKCTWDYAGNNDISDTSIGGCEMAGSVIETFSDGTYYTIRITRPTTGAGSFVTLVYNDQGSSYSPGWRTDWNSSNLTNLNQLTNGPGYITGESDTLATVTARGASTSTAVTLSSSNNYYGGHHYFMAYDANGNHYPHYQVGSNNNGAKVNIRVYTGNGSTLRLFYLDGQSGGMTWDGNTIWHSGNDGSGSGLDADLLDGLNSSAFVRTYGTNSNNIDSDYGECFITFDPVPSGTPPISSPNLRTINVGNNFARRTQMAFDYATDRAWFRRKYDSAWYSWNEFWHTGNDGSGSGLDADLLDGNHASAFALLAGNTGQSFGAFEFSYAQTAFNPAAAPRTGLNSMSVKMWDNYFYNTGLGSDYGTVMDYYSRNGHVNTQVYFDADGGSWYRTASYAAGWQSWQRYVTNSGTWGINVTGSAGSVPWSGVTSKPSNIMYYQGFTLDANTMDTNATGFTYSLNAPYTGPVVRFSSGGNYDLWLNADYGSGTNIAFRTRNGDIATLNAWNAFLHSANYNSYSPTLTGGGASGTWGINVTGTAGGETLATVTNRGSGTTGGITVNGTLIVGNSTNSYIYMVDTDETSRYIHCNSGRIGFLNSGGYWGSYCDNSGNWISVGDVTAYSDERVKENVSTIDNALEKTLALRGVTYTRKDTPDKSRKVGVIAQEIQKVIPEVVSEQVDGMMGVSYGNLAGVFIEAIKEQQVQIEDLKKQIAYLVENR